ncbi:hypothetical protein BaRGS_00020751 [Batillaria attramentaria]|uniref:Major facilitator superfamily (MFS) profile domain-containing protein n=1 Tax=Batillaria attramentaria TaxID=370345 RepID=A0ABD0KL75_9CAEN
MAPNEKKANPNGTATVSDLPSTSASNRGNGQLVTDAVGEITKDDGPPDRVRHDSANSNVSIESYANYIPTPPDGGWGWVIVFASLVSNLIVDGIGYSFGVFLKDFTDYFHSTKSKVSLVGSLLCGVYLFAGPVVSALTNKFGCRLVAFAGSIMAGVSFLLSTMSPSVDVLIITYGVMGGFGLGMIYLPSIVSVGYYFEKKRALATGIAVCGSGIGTFIFAPLRWTGKNALLIVSGITLQGAVCAMLMRPLQPATRTRRPRAKNLLDRIKEQAKGGRDRTISETSQYAYSVRDNNAVLERVMEAKLLRERRLQEDDSELGSLPSIFFVKQHSRKDSRVHKLSLSDRGDVTSYLGSPSVLGSVPRIVVHDGTEATSPQASGLSVVAENGRAGNTGSDVAKEGDTGSAGRPAGSGEAQNETVSPETHRRGVEDTVSSLGEETFTDAETGTVEEGTFNDAESGTVGEGTNTERSDYFTPPTSPPDTSLPTTPERDGHVMTRSSPTKADVRHRQSDSEVLKLMTQVPVSGYTNGSLPSNIHHHVTEVVPLLETTVVNLGSEKNIWRLKNHLHGNKGGATAGQSLHSLSVSKKDLARPLYRKDIFYSGSVLNIPQFRSQPDMKSYITSITTIPGELAYLTGESKSCSDTLQEMLDMSLLKDPGFLLICLGNVLAFLGFYVPFVYCVDFAQSMGIDSSSAAFIISVIGITNTVGRVMTGWLADMRRIDSLVITYVSIFICGIATAAFPFCHSYGTLCVVAAIFGLSVAAFISLSSILICDLLGLEKLTNGFGLMTMFRGMAAMAGPPLAGFVYDSTKSYDASFYLGGALLAAGAACHLGLKLPCVVQAEPKIFVEVIEEPAHEETGSGVKPEIVTFEEAMTTV